VQTKFIMSGLWEGLYCPPYNCFVHTESFVVGSRASIWQNKVQGTKVSMKLMHSSSFYFIYLFFILSVPTDKVYCCTNWITMLSASTWVILAPVSLMLKNKRPNWCHLLFYFTSYVRNMFWTLIYPSSGACDYSVELPHWSYCSCFSVCWSFSVVGLEWYPCCRHIIRSLRLFCWITTLVVLFLVRCVFEFWCGWVGVVSVLQAEAQLPHGYHSNPITLKLQHTSNQEQYNQCGNSTE